MTEKNKPDTLSPFGGGGVNTANSEANLPPARKIIQDPPEYAPSDSPDGPETTTQEDRGQLKWNEQRK
jgi:hypothetical protein